MCVVAALLGVSAKTGSTTKKKHICFPLTHAFQHVGPICIIFIRDSSVRLSDDVLGGPVSKMIHLV